MKTYSPSLEDLNCEWYVVDAKDQILGRLAAQLSHRLRGKHKPEFAHHMDNGDYIVIINCEKIRFTGTKLADKKYYSHSGYVGGLKEASLAELLVKKPEEILYNAVRGMLPKNRIGRAQLKKLKIYVGDNHPHAAQAPKQLTMQYK